MGVKPKTCGQWGQQRIAETGKPAALRHAAADPVRLCVMADYAAPADVPLSGVIDLGN